MRLVLWHGYLLSGTGSNIYTQHVAGAWARLGHDVRVLCQEPHPELFSAGQVVDAVLAVALGRPDPQLRPARALVGRADAREARQVAGARPGVEALRVA